MLPSAIWLSKLYLRRLIDIRFDAGLAALRFGADFAFLVFEAGFAVVLLCLKMLNGKYADTIQFGPSTISLIFKSTAAPHRE